MTSDRIVEGWTIRRTEGGVSIVVRSVDVEAGSS